MSTKRTCLVCKKEYSYCPHCDGDLSKPHWMVLFCSQKCHDIEEIINDHAFNKISDKEAISKLKMLDTSTVSFVVKEYIDKLMQMENNIKTNNEVPNKSFDTKQTMSRIKRKIR
jgi:hypothetical protein